MNIWSLFLRFIITTYLFLFSTVSIAQNKVSLEHRFSTFDKLPEGQLIDSLYRINFELMQMDLDFSKTQLIKLQESISKYNYYAADASILRLLAYFDRENCKEYLNQARNLVHSHNLSSLKPDLYKDFSYYFKDNNQPDSAMFFALIVRDIYRLRNNEKGLVDILHLIGDLHFHAKLYDKARKLYHEVLTLKGDSIAYQLWRHITIINNLGLIEKELKNYKLARTYFKQALDTRMSKKRKVAMDSISISYIYLQLAELELEDGQYDSAIFYYTTGKPIAEFYKQHEFVLGYKLVKTGLLLMKKEFSLALAETRQAFSQYQLGSFSNDYLIHIYERFVECHEQLADYDSALIFYHFLDVEKDKLYQKDLNAAYIQMLMEKDHELMAEQLNNSLSLKQKLWFGLIIASVILILLVPYSLWLRRMKRKLTTIKIELTEANNELSATAQQLNISNKTKEKFFSVIAHDLRGPLSSLVGLSDLLLEEINSNNHAQQKMMVDMISISSKNAHNLLINLLDWARIQSEKIQFNPESIHINKLFKELIENYHLTAAHKEISLDFHADQSAFIFADQNMLKTILRNLISNAIKFTAKGGKVTVVHKSENGNHFLSIQDNGIGMSKEKVQNVFDGQNGNSSKGTQNEEGTGLGIYLVKEFITYHNGKLEVESKPGSGSIIRVVIPGA